LTAGVSMMWKKSESRLIALRQLPEHRYRRPALEKIGLGIKMGLGCESVREGMCVDAATGGDPSRRTGVQVQRQSKLETSARERVRMVLGRGVPSGHGGPS